MRSNLLSLISAALPSERHGGADQEYFPALPAASRSRWFAFACSAALHLVGLLVVPGLTQHLAAPSERELWLQYVRQTRLMETLRIRVPERLYLASRGPGRAKLANPVRPARKAADAPAARKASGEQGRAPGRRRRVELPALRPQPDRDQTVLQPQFAADLLPSRDLRLPELFFWAPPVEPRVIRPFVMPGQAGPPKQVALLDAPPRLQLPGQEPSAAALERLPPAWVQSAAAVLAPPPAMPIQARPEGAAAQSGNSVDALPGDPTAVLALSGNPLPLRELLTVPPGNQLGRPPGEEGGRAEAAGGRGHGVAGAGDNGPSPPVRPPETSSAMPAPAAAPARAPGTAVGAEPLAAAPPAAARPRLPAAAEATRLEHAADGIFDVVVQSAGLEGFPESAGVLSGKPVYSVFLAVGSAKDWILQYCIPAGDAQEVETSGPVVRLGAPSAPTAPYPRVTMRPLIYRRHGAYTMVHGFIDPNGRFQELKVLGAHDPQESGVILAVLEQWEFRPAMRDGRPARVEVLLAMASE